MKNRMYKQWQIALLLLFSAASWGANLDRGIASEIDQYIHGLQSQDHLTVKATADKISASGLNDNRLYGAVEKVIGNYHQAQLLTPRDKALASTMTSLLRAISASGEQKYSSVLNEILHGSPSRASRNRAKHSLNKISWYAARNKIMQDTANHQPGQSAISTRYLNLLNHADPKMNRYAAEELYRLGKAEDIVLSKIMASLRQGLHQNSGKIHNDTIAWYCRVSVKLGSGKYQQEIQHIIDDESVDKKIRKHCRKEMERVQG